MLKCNYVGVHYCRMYAISPSLSHSRLRQVLALGNLESHRSREIHIFYSEEHSSIAVWRQLLHSHLTLFSRISSSLLILLRAKLSKIGIWDLEYLLKILTTLQSNSMIKKILKKKHLFNYYINPFIFTTTCLQACSCSFAQLHNQCLATKPVCGEPILQSVFFSARRNVSLSVFFFFIGKKARQLV